MCFGCFGDGEFGRDWQDTASLVIANMERAMQSPGIVSADVTADGVKLYVDAGIAAGERLRGLTHDQQQQKYEQVFGRVAQLGERVLCKH